MSGQTLDGKHLPRASNRGWESELEQFKGKQFGNLLVTTGGLMRVGKSQRAGLEVRCVGCGNTSVKAVVDIRRGKSGA